MPTYKNKPRIAHFICRLVKCSKRAFFMLQDIY